MDIAIVGNRAVGNDNYSARGETEGRNRSSTASAATGDRYERGRPSVEVFAASAPTDPRTGLRPTPKRSRDDIRELNGRLQADSNVPHAAKDGLIRKTRGGYSIEKNEGKTTITLDGKKKVELTFSKPDGPPGATEQFPLDIGSELTYQDQKLVQAKIKVPASCGNGACPPEPEKNEGYQLGNHRIVVEYGASIEYERGANGTRDQITVTLPYEGARTFEPIRIATGGEPPQIRYRIAD